MFSGEGGGYRGGVVGRKLGGSVLSVSPCEGLEGAVVTCCAMFALVPACWVPQPPVHHTRDGAQTRSSRYGRTTWSVSATTVSKLTCNAKKQMS